MSVSFNIQIPGESAVAVTLSTDAVQSITQYINTNPITAGGTTLASPVLPGDVSMTLASAAGLATGMGLIIGTETSLVTAIVGNVATVVRARVGTTAAAYPANTPVVFARSGSYGEYVTNLIKDQVVIAMTQFPATTIANANAAIGTAQATINTALAGAVTHVP